MIFFKIGECMKYFSCLLMLHILLFNFLTAQYSGNGNHGDPLSETALYPVPKEMTFEEYKDMNRRMSQAFLWSSIPIPGITHYYAGEIKKSKKLFYIGMGGLACIIVGSFSMEEGEWPEYNQNHIIFNQGKDNEKRFEKIPVGMEGEVVHYKLQEIRKEQNGNGGGLIFAGLAIVLGDFIYDRVKGLQVIEDKRDKVRFKYGQKLNLSIKPSYNSLQNKLGFGLKFYFG